MCAVKRLKVSKKQPTFGDGESWRPLWSQNVKTNAAVAVDIWVVDSCGKCDLKTDREKRNAGGRGGEWGADERNNRKPNDVRLRHVLAGNRELYVPHCYFMYVAPLYVFVRLHFAYLWRFEGVVCGEVYGQEENPALVRTVIRSHYCGLPVKHVISYWSCRTLGWWVPCQVVQLLVNSFQSHCCASGSVRENVQLKWRLMSLSVGNTTT